MTKKIDPFKLVPAEQYNAKKETENKTFLIDFCLWMKTEYDEKTFEPAPTLVDRYLKSLKK